MTDNRGRHARRAGRRNNTVSEMAVAGFISGAVIVDVIAVAALALALVAMPGTGVWGWVAVVTLWVIGIVWTVSVVWASERRG